jgi:hypothetical protein
MAGDSVALAAGGASYAELALLAPATCCLCPLCRGRRCRRGRVPPGGHRWRLHARGGLRRRRRRWWRGGGHTHIAADRPNVLLPQLCCCCMLPLGSLQVQQIQKELFLEKAEYLSTWVGIAVCECVELLGYAAG